MSEELKKGIPKAIVIGKVTFTEEEKSQFDRDFEHMLKEMGVLKENQSIYDMNKPTSDDSFSVVEQENTLVHTRISHWKEEFAPHILARGQKYYEDGKVRRIQRCGNTYIASVEGTEDYRIDISFADTKIEHMYCNCPYALENNCKHMAAVLFALEDDGICVEALPPAKQPPIVSHIPLEMPWLEAIDKLPEEIVRKELLKRADRDDRLKERLALLYLGKLPEGQLQNWKADLQNIAGEYLDPSGRINDVNTWEFLDDLSNFLIAKLPLLLEVDAVMDAFHTIWITMETAVEWEIDDYYGYFVAFFDDCLEALRKTWAQATQEQQAQMLQWYNDHRNDEWPGGVEQIDEVFELLTTPNESDRGRRVVKYFEEIPCFLIEGEWVSFPEKGDIYYDFVEETTAYKEALPVVEEIIKKNLGEFYGHFGSCHRIWQQREQLLWDMYGIEWLSPAILNRSVDFD